MASMQRDPFIKTPTANTFATGTKKFGVGQTNNATSGALPSAGYNARDRKKKARSNAIQNMLPASGGDANATAGAAPAKGNLPPWLNKK